MPVAAAPADRIYADCVASLPSLEGRVFAITGTTSGTGYYACQAAIQRNAAEASTPPLALAVALALAPAPTKQHRGTMRMPHGQGRAKGLNQWPSSGARGVCPCIPSGHHGPPGTLSHCNIHLAAQALHCHRSRLTLPSATRAGCGCAQILLLNRTSGRAAAAGARLREYAAACGSATVVRAVECDPWDALQ